MKRKFQVIEWSRDMKQGYRYAKTAQIERDRNRLDRLFERNMMIQQKIIGAVIAVLSIIVAWFLSEKYGQTEYFLMTFLFVGFGIWLITTKRNTIKEIREA